MRVAQIIDSLEAGGAERIAVAYANALVQKVAFSGLVVTRKQGPLQNQIAAAVPYLFLKKKHSLDFRAVLQLRRFVIQNKIEIIHAHGTSFFIAFLLKIVCPKVKIFWHEHYGARAKESRGSNVMLIFCSFFFSKAFVVSHQLQQWVKNTLYVKAVFYIPNFADLDSNFPALTTLKGEKGKRIVCVANLKHPKNHLAILEAVRKLQLNEMGWSVHFIGKDYCDDYSYQLKAFIKRNSLESSAFIYGAKNDISYILSQGSIGLLASLEEGFPVTLLEYGLAKLPVVSTNVGACGALIKEGWSGLLFDPKQQTQLESQLLNMVMMPLQREEFSLHLQELVHHKYAKEAIIEELLKCYNSNFK